MATLYHTKAELIKKFITKESSVLDVGFWGQGTNALEPGAPHMLIRQAAKEVYGLDITFDAQALTPADHYFLCSAESFDFHHRFDVIFAGDLIEHLSNPGQFIVSCTKSLKPNGLLVITTPNCFSLFNLAEKLTKFEPSVNADHTCYFSIKTIKSLLRKNGVPNVQIDFLYRLDSRFPESFRKKMLNGLYWLLSFFTHKYIEDLVITARVPG